MPNFMAMSFEGEHAPSFDLKCLRAEKRPDGWGLGWYPGGEPSASVLKEPAPPPGSIRSQLVRAWENLESSLFLMHVRHATWGQNSDANTQPFLRSWGGRDWTFCHSGSLDEQLPQVENARFTPVGVTDSERIFCELLNWAHSKGWRRIADCDLEALRNWFEDMNGNGSTSLILSDGHDLCVYADCSEEQREVYVCEVRPPYSRLVFGDEDLEVNLTRRGVKSHKGVVISAKPLMPPVEEKPSPQPADPPFDWWRLKPGHLVVIRRGAIRAAVPRPERPAKAQPSEQAPAAAAKGSVPTFTPMQGAKPESQPRRRDLERLLSAKAQVQRLEVRHRTVYRYTKPVERSVHTLRLEPAHDRLQNLIEHSLHISVPTKSRRLYEDVFGNRVLKLEVDSPFSEMVIESYSRVELKDVAPLEPQHHVRTRSTIPLIWMPWQRHMLQPYLLPQELPETQLAEIADYAMSFVKRNDYDLLETLLDMNISIFREYKYQQNSTTLATTPFDVYVNRRGVCQDFANLFICMARMLGIPARYVCGYIYTGPKNENKIQSEASHAWVELYLPEIGWKGFDPTNGILVQTDHVRVAHGRTYVDATPTSGTIFVGGGPETLEVSVRCEPCD